MTRVTCDTCGKTAEREDAQDAGWLLYEIAECDACLEARKRDAYREYRRDRIEADHEASKRAKYPGLVP